MGTRYIPIQSYSYLVAAFTLGLLNRFAIVCEVLTTCFLFIQSSVGLGWG